jgi:hypothetical protein
LRDRHRRAGPVGAHGARFKHGDLHPERGDLLGETDGEPGDGPFRRLVGGQARAGQAGAERGDLENVTISLLAEVSPA